MRVATYTESAAPSRASVVELGILLSAILLGTGAVPTLVTFFGGSLGKLITPLWLLLYMGAFLGLMFRHGINWITWLVRYRILLVFLLLGTVASTAWSINPQMTVERSVHLVGSSLVAIYIGFSLPLLFTLRVFAVTLAFIMFATLAVAIGLPEVGIEAYEGSQVWKGVFQSKNDLGFWAGAGVLLYVTLSESSESVSGKMLCFMMAGVCLGLLAMSQSATSLVAMAVSGSLALYLYIANRFQLGFFRMAFVAVLFVSLVSLIVANVNTNELVGRSGDLTGRGEVWTQVIKLILDQPLKGVGYGALWFPTDETLWVQKTFFDFTWVVYHAHNGLLHIASEIGIPLSLVALLMVTQQLIEIFYCQYQRRHVGVLFVLAFVVAFLISNYSEARFLMTRELFWIFFLALPISMLRQINMASPAVGAEDAYRHTEHPLGDMDMPWLRPVHSGPMPAAAAIPAGYGAAAMLTYSSDASAETVDETTSDTSALSLSETDIDLGNLVGGLDDTHMPADTPEDTVYIPVEQPATTFRARRSEVFDHIDHFDYDRYDINLDMTGEWVDIDLFEGK